MLNKQDVVAALVGHELVYQMVTRKRATKEFAAEKASEFSDAFLKAFEGQSDSACWAALKFYTKEFGVHFRPGFTLTPERCLLNIEDALEVVELATVDAAPACTFPACGCNPAERCEGVVAEEPEVEEVEEVAEEPEVEEVVEEPEVAEEPSADAEILEKLPVVEGDYREILIADLPLHGSAIRAFLNAGLETVADLEDYSAIAPLEEIKGVGDEWEADTLKIIELLKDA